MIGKSFYLKKFLSEKILFIYSYLCCWKFSDSILSDRSLLNNVDESLDKELGGTYVRYFNRTQRTYVYLTYCTYER